MRRDRALIDRRNSNLDRRRPRRASIRCRPDPSESLRVADRRPGARFPGVVPSWPSYDREMKGRRAAFVEPASDSVFLQTNRRVIDDAQKCAAREAGQDRADARRRWMMQKLDRDNLSRCRRCRGREADVDRRASRFVGGSPLKSVMVPSIPQIRPISEPVSKVMMPR